MAEQIESLKFLSPLLTLFEQSHISENSAQQFQPAL
jgi:hypothetical protein